MFEFMGKAIEWTPELAAKVGTHVDDLVYLMHRTGLDDGEIWDFMKHATFQALTKLPELCGAIMDVIF